MADMKSFDEQMPCVGIFWYDMETKSFFGVRKQEITPKMVEEAAEKGIPFINYPHLHRQVWTKSISVLKPGTRKASSLATTPKCLVVVSLGMSTSS